jgi:S-adenosyl-L-methionine hydrolase (adenosine-forming)
MAVITLTSDWGFRDHYLASLKGSILCRYPDLMAIDLSHQVNHFDILQASHIIRNSYHKFPKGTAHVILLTSSGGKRTSTTEPLVAIESEGYYFVGIDSGIFSLILPDEEKKIFRLRNKDYTTFENLYLQLVEAGNHLAKGGQPEEIGDQVIDLKKSVTLQPHIEKASIRATVIYIDSFGNLVFNITRQQFYQAGEGRPFSIFLNSSASSINRISKTYSEIDEGEAVALFNSDGFLEIGLNNSNAETLLGIKIHQSLRIEFHDR